MCNSFLIRFFLIIFPTFRSLTKLLQPQNNSVHHNNIHHVMCGDLIDGGPIYTLGPQPNSSLHHNWLHHICNRYGLLYHDSGSEGFSDYVKDPPSSVNPRTSLSLIAITADL